MNKKELNNKAQIIFDTNKNENTLYCIDDGNFWIEKNFRSANKYAFQLNKELIIIKKEDLIEDIKPIKKKVKRTSTKK